MHRRDATLGLLGAGALTLGLFRPQGADANLVNDRPLFDATSRVRLQIARQTILLTWIYILSGGRTYGIDLRQQVPQFNENRVNIGGLIGGLARATMKSRLTGATLLGHLFIYETYLILLAANAGFSPLSTTIVAHRDLSWEPGRIRRVTPKGLPTVAALQATAAVGKAFIKSDQLIVMVSPTRTKIPLA